MLTILNAHTSSSNTSAHTFGNIAGQISDGQMPGSFTRDSELLFSNIGGTLSDAQIPANITRDSELLFSNIGGMLSDSQIPANITRDGEVTSFIDSRVSTLTGDGTLATGAALAAEASTRSSADTTINGRINDLTTAISNETSTRAAAVSTLQGNIDTKVAKTGDTMSGDLTMNANIAMRSGATVDGVDISDLNNTVRGPISSHETRLRALEGAPGPGVAKAWVKFHTDGRDRNAIIDGSFNVSSVIYSGDDNSGWLVTFTTPFSDANYVMAGSTGGDHGTAMMLSCNSSISTASQAYVIGTDKNGNSQTANARPYNVVFFGY